MPEPMSEEAEEQIRYIASMDAPGPFSEKAVGALRVVLAEVDRLRTQLAEIGDEWGYETMNGWSGWCRCTTPMTEEYARKRAGESDRNRLVHRKAGDWREVTE